MTRERVAKPVHVSQPQRSVTPAQPTSAPQKPGRLARTLEARAVTPAELEARQAQHLELQRARDLEAQARTVQRDYLERSTQARVTQTKFRTTGTRSLGVQRAVSEHLQSARVARDTRASFIAQRSSDQLKGMVAQRLEDTIRPPLEPVQRQSDLTLSHVADHMEQKAVSQISGNPDALRNLQGFKNAGATLVGQFRVPGSRHTMPDLAKSIQRFRDPWQRAAVEASAYTAFGSHPSFPGQLQRALDEQDAKLDVQRAAWKTELEPVAQRLAEQEASGENAANFIEQARGGGQPLPENVRAMLETKWNTDLSRVRVHTDSGADVVSRKLNARALTSGSNIFFRAGGWNPTSLEGLQLIAHETWHTVQQAGGRVQAGIDKSASLELEARGKGAELSSTDLTMVSSATPKPVSAPSASSRTGQRFRATHATPRAIQRQKVEAEETPIGKRAFVREEGLNLRAKPDQKALSLTTLPFGARVLVVSQSGGWYRVVTETGKSGYMLTASIHGLQPQHQALLEADPGLRLFKVKPAETGMQLVRRAYGITGAEGSKDQNLWHFLNAIRKRNQSGAFGYKDLGWADAAQNAMIPGADANNVLLKANNDLWIPSFSIAARDNSVGSGTPSGEIRRLGKNIEQKVKDFQAAQAYANQAMGTVFAKRLEEGAGELIGGLVTALVGAAAILVGSTAIGAIIGAFAGGVGAAPGAAIGFQIGTWVLEWLGVPRRVGRGQIRSGVFCLRIVRDEGLECERGSEAVARSWGCAGGRTGDFGSGGAANPGDDGGR